MLVRYSLAVLFLVCVSQVGCSSNVADTGLDDASSISRISDDKRSQQLVASGIEWVQKGEREKAIADFTEAIRLDPDNADAYACRAQWGQGGRDQTIADYTEIIRLDPTRAGVFMNRGHEWRDKQAYDEAIADYTEAVRLDEKLCWPCYANRAEVWVKKGMLDEAISDYTEYIRVKPVPNFMDYKARAKIWRLKGDNDKADADEAKAEQLMPKG